MRTDTNQPDAWRGEAVYTKWRTSLLSPGLMHRLLA